jgi:hypothetical protein
MGNYIRDLNYKKEVNTRKNQVLYNNYITNLTSYINYTLKDLEQGKEVTHSTGRMFLINKLEKQ